MTKITLLKGKGRQRIPFEMEGEEIIEKFAKSLFPKEYDDRPEEVRLALFVAWSEPIGLDATFPNAKEFNTTFKLWTENKSKYEGLLYEHKSKIKRRK